MSDNALGAVLGVSFALLLSVIVLWRAVESHERNVWFAACTQKHSLAECEHGLAVLRSDRDAPEKP